MKLSSIKLSVFTDLVTVCLHARTHTLNHTSKHAVAYANYVLLRKLVCVSFMNIIIPQIGTTVTLLRQDEMRRGTRRVKARLRAALAAHKEFFFNLAVKQRATFAPKKKAKLQHECAL